MSLTAERLREVLAYDPESGLFTWLIRPSMAVRIGDVAGSLSDKGYLIIRINKQNYKGHRLAWLYIKGEWPVDQIDHINHVKSDNRVANLRAVTNAENGQNRDRPHRNSKSGVRGVHYVAARDRWCASIRVSGRLRHVGHYKTAEEAHQAYLNAKAELHPAWVKGEGHQ